MKTIVCYGDSNTWGANGQDGSRHGRWVRWPGVLQQVLGEDYYVIEEGLGGRTTVWDDPIEGHKNGKTYLPPCLDSHKPVDLVVLMLGTNDTKIRFSVTAFDIANSAGVLVKMIRDSLAGPAQSAPQVLLIAPPGMGELRADFAQMFVGAPPKAAQFPEQFQRVARELGCEYLDAQTVTQPDSADGLHLDAESHRRLGEAVAARVKALLG